MLTTFLPVIAVLAGLQTPLLPQFVFKSPPLGLGATIIASFSAHSLLFTWVRWSYDHHRSAGGVLQVCGWHNLCRPVVDP